MHIEHWEQAVWNPDLVSKIARVHGLTRPTALLLANRPVPHEKLEPFFHPKLQELSDPYRIPGIREAAKRIWRAIRDGERILVYGDYDTDGMTSAVLLSQVLRENGGMPDIFLPDRLEDGYGLHPDVVRRAAEDGYQLLITVDCGISGTEGAAQAREVGLDLIITDHHQPPRELPDALACINPKLFEELKDLYELAGVGVCFKLCHGFIKYGREQGLGGFACDLRDMLDLVALGTVADIVPLLGENRSLVKFGLEVLSRQQRPGIRALCEKARVESPIRSQDVAFRLAPRLNAAGRLGHAEDALALLRADSIVDSYALATTLDGYNRERQQAELNVFRAAQKNLASQDMGDRFSLVVAGRNWHPGVIGIVASRLVRQYHRPSIVLSIDDNGIMNGSGRSLPGVDLVHALDACTSFLESHGGHPMAVGLSLKQDQLEAFCLCLEKVIREQQYGTLPPRKLTCDGAVELEELNEKFFSELQLLQPFGHSYPAPLFRFPCVRSSRVRICGKKNSRGMLQDATGTKIPFILFGLAPEELPAGDWDVAGTPELYCRGSSSYPQIQVVDVRAAGKTT